MTHSRTTSVVIGALLLSACSNEAEHRQTQRHEEMRTQTHEMQEQREQNRAERQTSRAQGEAAEARGELAEQRQDLAGSRRPEDEARDVDRARQDLQQRSRELAEAANKACAGLPDRAQEACPVSARSVASVEDVRNGVKVHLAANAGDADALQRRISCHNARRELANDAAASAGRPIDTQTMCFLDVAGVETDVDETRGRVSVSVTTPNAENLDRVRTLARQGTHAAPPLRTTGGHVKHR